MVIAKIGNPIIPDTSDASRAQYEQLKKLSAEYGVDVTLFPAKGTQEYNDWYANFPRACFSRAARFAIAHLVRRSLIGPPGSNNLT